MDITIIITLVAVAIVAIVGLGFWYHRRRLTNKSAAADQQPVADAKPSTRTMSQEELMDWQEMEVILADIHRLELLFGQVIMPSDIASRTAKINQLLSSEGFGFAIAPAECLGCLLDQINFYKASRKQEPLPIIAVFRHANRIIHRQHQLPMEQDLNQGQLKELEQLIKDLSDQAKAKKSGPKFGAVELPAVTNDRAGQPKVKPAIANSVEELARLEATFHTKKLIADAGKELSAEEKQAIFAEQYRIALEKCREKYG